MRTYIRELILPDEAQEWKFILAQKKTCYNGIYPFKIFPQKELRRVEFEPLTVFYGGNGSGKTTLLNIIAQLAEISRCSVFSGGAFFKDYLDRCELDARKIPKKSRILTSDDVFDYLLNVRNLNNGIDVKREKIFEDLYARREAVMLDPANMRLKSMEQYDDWKETADAMRKSASAFVKDRVMGNVSMFSNGESALRFFIDHIEENAVYLLDEPENSLSIALQMELKEFLELSARFANCQIILATHSPILLSMKGAFIYDLDSAPVETKPWTELENVRKYFDFFDSHRNEFLTE